LIYTGSIQVPAQQKIGLSFSTLRSQIKLRKESSLHILVEAETALSRTRRLSDCYSWDLARCSNGSIIIVESSTPLNDEIIDQYPVADDDSLSNYFIINEIPPPLKVEEYLQNVGDLTEIQIYKFETLLPQFVIRIPRISVPELCAFLLKLGVECNPQSQQLLIFNTQQNKRLPNREPLVRTLPENLQCLFYLIVPRDVIVSQYQSVIVVFSDDGFHTTARRALFLRKDFSSQAVKDSFNDLIPENKQIRVLSIKNHEIEQIFTPKQRFTNFDYTKQVVRIEVIPDDQIDVPQNELLQVVQVDVDNLSYFKPVAFPFYLNCPPETAIETIREMIKERLKIADDVMARYRFVPMLVDRYGGIEYRKFELGQVLKREQRVGKEAWSPKGRLLMVRPGDRKKGRGITGSIQIKN
jgi:hypothetical protein